MDILPIVIGVAGLSASGFIFLLVLIIRLNTQIEKRATYDWCEEQLVKKDVFKVILESIKSDIAEIKRAMNKIANIQK